MLAEKTYKKVRKNEHLNLQNQTNHYTHLLLLLALDHMVTFVIIKFAPKINISFFLKISWFKRISNL